ncbi:MAG: CRISPR-associated ring nuclease Csm6, partial [Gammaproteobacteria bacterium]|nr:CRISPR-associated ring nuclease Csm6 [Gammaproteobacteria bacterium]
MLDQNMQKILLVVCGMSPQVMTETLYALIRERNWIPNKIHLITTEKGRENAVMQLLEGEKHFQQLLNDYQVSQSIDFNVKNITVIKDNNDHVLADLRTPEDNEA